MSITLNKSSSITFISFYRSGQLPGLKYSTGLSTWPVFHKDEFYTSYADCKQAQGSEFWLSLTGAALDFRNGLLLLILGSMFV